MGFHFLFNRSQVFLLFGRDIDENEIVSFKNAGAFSSRAKWSCASTLGISLIEKLVLHDDYRYDYEEEVKSVCSMLEKRSDAFLESAKKVGLKTLPYEKGFFICVPCKDPEKMMNALHEDKVHLVCTHSCLRIALCAINKDEASRLPAIIKKYLDILEK